MKDQSKNASGVTLPGSLHALLRHLLRDRWERHRHELKACQRQFTEESVHESRVAARRLLATVELLASLHETNALRRARRTLKAHLDLLAPLRDAQVQLQFAADLPAARPAGHDFEKFLRQRANQAARRAEKGVARLKIHRLAKLVGRFDKKLCRPGHRGEEPGDFRVLLSGATRAFARAQTAKARIHATRPETIHRTRIAFKKFRYTVELLAPLLPGMPAGRLEALRRYQRLLGDIQDATVLLATLTEFAEIEPLTTRALLQKAQRRRDQLIRRYLRHADRLDAFWPVAQK